MVWYYACRKLDWINAFPLFKFKFVILETNLLRYVVMSIMMINVLLNINGS